MWNQFWKYLNKTITITGSFLDINLEEWSTKEYSEYYNDVHKYALFDESISQLHQWYIDNPDQTGSIFDKIVVVEEDDLKVAVIVINYFESERDNKKECRICRKRG